MAAHLTKQEGDEFYVYGFWDSDFCIYIGKGSNKRINAQKRRFQLPGKIIAWFKREKEAYKYECEMIAKHKPQLNKHAGGNGSRKRPERYKRTKDEILMDKIGTKAYAARLLLAYYRINPPKMLELGLNPSNLEMLRQVAYG